MVLGIRQRRGDVIARVVPNGRSDTMPSIVAPHVKPHTEIHTDKWRGYSDVGAANEIGTSE